MCVGSIVLQALLIGIVGTNKVTLTVEGGTLAAPALCPVRLNLCGLLGVLECAVPFSLGGVGS